MSRHRHTVWQGIAAFAFASLALAGCTRSTGNETLGATTTEPRAYGYHVGDRAQRVVDVEVPEGLTLDPDSLPRAGAPGQPLELRAVDWRRASRFDRRHYRLRLSYQVFIAPADVRTFELPPLQLRFKGRPRDQDLRVDAWPVTVSPLVPTDVSPRRGLGEMQPDAEPLHLDETLARRALLACGAAMLLPLGWLFAVYVGVPWRHRRRRPFGLAWQALKTLKRQDGDAFRASCQRLHDALNRSAGEVLFEPGLDRFIAARPAYAPARGALATFFDRSRRAFFDAEAGAPDATWFDELRGLSRQLRDIERGSA